MAPNTPCERGGKAAERATFHKILTEISFAKKLSTRKKYFIFNYSGGGGQVPLQYVQSPHQLTKFMLSIPIKPPTLLVYHKLCGPQFVHNYRYHIHDTYDIGVAIFFLKPVRQFDEKPNENGVETFKKLSVGCLFCGGSHQLHPNII